MGNQSQLCIFYNIVFIGIPFTLLLEIEHDLVVERLHRLFLSMPIIDHFSEEYVFNISEFDSFKFHCTFKNESLIKKKIKFKCG